MNAASTGISVTKFGCHAAPVGSCRNSNVFQFPQFLFVWVGYRFHSVDKPSTGGDALLINQTMQAITRLIPSMV